jgi:tripartite-type tricarboxylate transporter receptor subunit TctC
MRKQLCATMLIAAAASWTAPAAAEWPQDEAIKFVIPYSPGGGFDTYVRTLAPALEKELGEGAQVVPENVPGAGGNKGSALVVRAEPDGYTIGIFNIPGLTVAQLRGDELSFDPSSITWLANLGTDRYGIAVAGDSELQTIEDFCNLGRPAKLSQTGPTSSGYVTAKIAFEIMECPYEIITGYQGSSEAFVAVMRGEVDGSVRPIGSTMKYIESGDMRMVMTFEEESSLEGVQSAVDAGHPEVARLGLERMVGGPPGMPEDVVERLSQAIVNAAQSPEVQEWAKSTNNALDPVGAPEATQLNSDLSEYYARYREHLSES